MRKRIISKIKFGSLFAQQEKETKINLVKADFTFNPDTDIEEDTLVSFINTSENAKDYVWDFGDGNVSTDPNPKHKFNKGGEYKVKLIALGEQESDSSKQCITIKP